jgi:hypothetical protein
MLLTTPPGMTSTRRSSTNAGTSLSEIGTEIAEHFTYGEFEENDEDLTELRR